MTRHKIADLSAEFRTHNIPRLILKYAVPAALGSFMMTVYNIVDRIFISRVMGQEAVAGIGITFQIFMLFIAVGVMFGVGSGTLASLQLGRGHFRSAEKVLGTLYWIFTFGGIATCIIGLIFIEPIIRLYGGSDVTMPYAKEYLGILLFFMPFDFMSMGTNNIIRSEGNPRFSMWNIAVGCIANIILDYIFIFPLNMGIAGAAWATGISKLLSSILVFWHFRYSPHRALTLRWKYFRFDWLLFKRMCYIGLSPFMMQGVFALMAVVLNYSLYKYGGDTAIAVMTINGSIFMLMSIPNTGILFGFQPIAGYNYGAGLFHRAASCLKFSLLFSVGITLLVLIAVQIGAPWIFGLFCRNDPEMVANWTYSLRLVILNMPFWAFFVIASNFFQATGRPVPTILLNIFRQGLLTPALVLLLPLLLGINGVWCSFLLADLVVFTVTAILIVREYRRLQRRRDQKVLPGI